MFGLMKMRGCRHAQGLRTSHRHHYCGVCKTIGREYGQGTRLALNHDMVLVAELMSAISTEPAWDGALDSRNCLRAPRESPLALRYAAAANVLLAGAKTADHVADSGRLRWRILSRWLQPRYTLARMRLTAWGLPVDQIEDQLATQMRREASPASLEDLAEPTAFATASVFRHAARLAGRSAAEAALEGFGRRFGAFVYLLDAWQDFAKDALRGEFNAIAALFPDREAARESLLSAAASVERAMFDLPVSEPFRKNLLLRFRSNVNLDCAPAPAFIMLGGPGSAASLIPPASMLSQVVHKAASGGCGDRIGSCCGGCCCDSCDCGDCCDCCGGCDC